MNTTVTHKKLNNIAIGEWINANKAAELLGITTKTLTNYVCMGKIPADAIRVGCTGKKFFNSNKLIGL